MNNLLYLYKTLLKNINYNDLKPKIDTARKIGNVFVPISSFTSLLLALNTDFNTMIPMDINILSNITYLFLILSFPEHYTKDIEDIVSIYRDVVKSYVKLNDKLELKSPIDINAGLTFALNNGYLSYNKHFKYCTDNNKDILRSLGTETITGLACCRHIATLLNDILQEKNIKSYTIPALMKKDSADISFLQSIIGNHLITISEYNDKVYYLDPTNNKFLTRDNSSIIIIDGKLFKDLLDKNIYAQKFMLEITQSKLSEVMEVLEKVVFFSLEYRLSEHLIDQYYLKNALKFKVTHEAIANDLGSSREVISRVLT